MAAGGRNTLLMGQRMSKGPVELAGLIAEDHIFQLVVCVLR